MYPVTTVTPMKRGLKVSERQRSKKPDYGVTTVTPMKRGLKDQLRLDKHILFDVVTTVTPMKRGLKANGISINDRRFTMLQSFPR